MGEGMNAGRPRTELLTRCPIPNCDCLLTITKRDGIWRFTCAKHPKRKFRRLTEKEIKKYNLNRFGIQPTRRK